MKSAYVRDPPSGRQPGGNDYAERVEEKACDGRTGVVDDVERLMCTKPVARIASAPK